MEPNARAFEDKTVLVTGGTGSFGTVFVDRLLGLPVREVRVFSRDEQKHVALRRKYSDDRLTMLLGDVRDPQRIEDACSGVDYVFNAAAIKHVHLTERHPMEAVQTNILGALNVLRACERQGVERMVSISTDKAVQPVNVMGMTKALQERLVSSFAGRTDLQVGCVRYGNVLTSKGSVVPYFKELLEAGERTLPVTDEKMTRFLLTLTQGVDLVLYAFDRIKDGDVFVADLPAFRMLDLARAMLEAYDGGEIKFIGIRPGEKVHEVLVSQEEMRRTDACGEYYIVRPYESESELFQRKDEQFSSDTARHLTKAELTEVLKQEGVL